MDDKFRSIEIRARITAESMSQGLYRSAFKGVGLDYQYSRIYDERDDFRHIDSRVSARTGSLHTKVFNEERNIEIVLIINSSASLLLGYENRTKIDILFELVSILYYSAYNNGDKVGWLSSSDKFEFLAPCSSAQVFPSLLAICEGITIHTKPRNIREYFDYLYNVYPRKSLIFFINDQPSDDEIQTFKRYSNIYDIVYLDIKSNFEEMPKDNLYIKSRDIFDNNTKAFKANELKTKPKSTENAVSKFAKVNVDYISLDYKSNIVSELVALMQKRASRI